MKKIVFISDWGESSSDILKRYANQTPGNKGEWGAIKGVDTIEEADYIVVMDGVPANIQTKLDWSRVLYFHREPAFVKPYFMNHEFPTETFFVGTDKNHYCLPTWWINLPFDRLAKMAYPKKKRKISAITSGKTGYHTYDERLAFLKNFIVDYPKLDIYGRGTSFFGDNWKGELNYNGNCKFLGMAPYEYSLVLENTYEPNTWTEKAADAILSWSFPIYSGDSNFSSFFPEASFLDIDVVNPNNAEIIEFIKEPPSKNQIEALREARDLLLFKWNLWPEIERIIKERS